MKTKDELPACPVATAVALIGGKWKLLILRNLKSRPWRFNELQRDLDGISQKVLTDSLRQMIDDGLAYRHDFQEMPPRVEYGLTDLKKGATSFHMVSLPCTGTIVDFAKSARIESENNPLSVTALEGLGEPQIIYSCIPWADITMCSNERDYSDPKLKDDTAPILFGANIPNTTENI